MSITPSFMQHFAKFDRERRSIRTLREWNAFKKKWFDSAAWPGKTKEQLAREDIQRRKKISKIRDGRRWAPGFWLIDLTAEARYEYFWTLSVIGAPLRDPRWNTITPTAEGGWFQECGYCNISTPDLGSAVCPVCGRTMYYGWIKD